MIRNTVIYGKSPTIANQDEDEQPLYVRAYEMIARYENFLAGISYQSQGYSLDDSGSLPAWLIDEHKLVHLFYTQAKSEKT